MPVAYYGSQLSPHITETPEGYLICHDVPINRIGSQDYLGAEIDGWDGAENGKTYKIMRRKNEVLSPATLASFEGKPVCDGHPPEDVSTDNINFYSKGHAQNIRPDSVTGQTLADLFVVDASLINEIKNGKRDVSCGYTYDLFKNPNGTLEQRNIRGNHIAIVDKGRAGPTVCIRDSQPKSIERGKKNMTTKNGSIFGRMLHSFAKDADTTPEDLEEAAKLGKDEGVIKPENAVASPETEIPDKTPGKKGEDEDPMSMILKKLSEIEARLDRFEAAGKETEDGDELEKIIKGHGERETPEQEEAESPEGQEAEKENGDEQHFDEIDNENSVTEDPKDIPEPEEGYKPQVVKTGDSAAMIKAAKVARDILHTAYPKPEEYKQHAKDTAAALHKEFGVTKGGNGGYSQIMNAANTMRAKRVQMAKDSAPRNQNKIIEEAQAAYDRCNPHENGGK
jgi:hypothetical protein